MFFFVVHGSIGRRLRSPGSREDLRGSSSEAVYVLLRIIRWYSRTTSTKWADRSRQGLP